MKETVLIVLDAYLTHNLRIKDITLLLNGDNKACEIFQKW